MPIYNLIEYRDNYLETTGCLCYRSSRPELFLGKGVLKICSKLTGEHPCRGLILIKLQSNFVKITFQHGCSLVNLQHIFRTTFHLNTPGRLLLIVIL